MKNLIPNPKLRDLDLITYDMNYLIKKLRSLRNDTEITIGEASKQMEFFVSELGKHMDKLEDWDHEMFYRGTPKDGNEETENNA